MQNKTAFDILDEMYEEKLAATGILTGVKNLVRPAATTVGKALGKGMLGVGNALAGSGNQTIRNMGGKIGAKGINTFMNPTTTVKNIAKNTGLVAGGAAVGSMMSKGNGEQKTASEFLDEMVAEKLGK